MPLYCTFDSYILEDLDKETIHISEHSGMEEEFDRKMVLECILEILFTLKDRERLVIEHRFGLVDGHFRTLAEIGRIMGFTRERSRQIEAKALRKLKLIAPKKYTECKHMQQYFQDYA